MELFLALAVVAAVIFFGALISLGNERQRRAIDALREQAALWAVQDLRLKREKLAREVKVDDPLGWLNRVASKVTGRDFHLKAIEYFDIPVVLACESDDRSKRVLFTPLSPAEIRRLKREKRSRLSQYANQNPIFSLSGKSAAYELTILNAGILFDLEVAVAWKSLTGEALEGQCFWLYLIE